MEITKTTLEDLADFDKFAALYKEFVSDTLWHIHLMAVISPSRLKEAHEAWVKDKDRVEKNEKRLDGLNHFKQCGLLAFWIRRMSPITEATDMTGACSYTPDPFTEDEKAFEELITSYCNEYIAFDFGFQIVRFYELGKPGNRAENLALSARYYTTTCHFMKYKQVSPHALALIYKSLFAA